jgi:hypothetical protein
VNTKNTKTKFGEAVEIQTGQWSYAKLDSRVENFSQYIPLINVSDWIIAKDKKADSIKKLLAKLDDSRCEDRSKWWAVGMSIKKELGENGWDLFDEWSKNCNEKYDSDKNREIWDSMEPKDNMNINVLKNGLKMMLQKNVEILKNMTHLTAELPYYSFHISQIYFLQTKLYTNLLTTDGVKFLVLL